jgi:hypothetical protein
VEIGLLLDVVKTTDSRVCVCYDLKRYAMLYYDMLWKAPCNSYAVDTRVSTVPATPKS